MISKVSVAICTWNRASLLDKTLERFQSLIVPDGVDWELIVIDNNSPDDTQEVVSKHASKLPLRCEIEKKQGLSHARNKAISLIDTDLLLWTDDDVLVDPHWLCAYVNAATDNPRHSFFGGSIIPWFEKEPPHWMRDDLSELSDPFVVLEEVPGDEIKVGGKTPFGANMAFRMDAIGDLRFDTRLGRKGKSMLGAEDTIFVRELLRRGEKGLWVQGARVQHWVPEWRTTKRFLYRSFHGSSKTSQMLASMNSSAPLPFPRWHLRQYVESTCWRIIYAATFDRRWLSAFRMAAASHGRIAGWFASRGLSKTKCQNS